MEQFDGDALPRRVLGHREYAGVGAARCNARLHNGRRRDDGSIGDVEMTGDHRSACDLAVAANAHAARYAYATGNRGMGTDPAVVADLDLIVELDVVLDHRV